MTFAAQHFADFDDEMARTRIVLSAIPAEIMDWLPAEGMRSIGWNANHLAEIVGWTTDILSHDEFDVAPIDGPAYETPSISDPAEILAKFDSAVDASRAALFVAADTKFADPWTMKMGGQPLFTMNKGHCIRKWVLSHTIHHRGILSVYLRLRGVELMPVYDG